MKLFTTEKKLTVNEINSIVNQEFNRVTIEVLEIVTEHENEIIEVVQPDIDYLAESYFTEATTNQQDEIMQEYKDFTEEIFDMDDFFNWKTSEFDEFFNWLGEYHRDNIERFYNESGLAYPDCNVYECRTIEKIILENVNKLYAAGFGVIEPTEHFNLSIFFTGSNYENNFLRLFTQVLDWVDIDR